MSSIRVSGNTSGYYDLTVPDVAGQNTIPLDRVVTTDAGGNLGIGTTTPTQKFHVNSGTENIAAKFESTDGIGGIMLADNSGNVELTATGNTFEVRPAGGGSEFSVSTNGTSVSYLNAQGQNQVRLVLGSTGNYADNSSNWVRGNAGYLQFNNAGSGYTWETLGSTKMRLSPEGYLTSESNVPGCVALATNGFTTVYNAATTPWYDQNPWTTTAYNQGNHFNLSTGLFTAPVTGLYHVCIALEAVATSNSYGVYILKNGASYSAYTNGRIIAGNIRTTADLSVTVNLNANDTVGVRIYMSGTSNLSWDNNGYMSIHLVG